MTTPPTSDYLKIARAIDGDDLWRIRLNIALELRSLPRDRPHQLRATQAVVDKIACDAEGAVSTTNVTDADIDAALDGLAEEATS